MKTYYVEMVHKNEIPTDGWDVAVRTLKVYVKANNEEDAKDKAVLFFEQCGIHMKAIYVHEALKNEIF